MMEAVNPNSLPDILQSRKEFLKSVKRRSPKTGRSVARGLRKKRSENRKNRISDRNRRNRNIR